jgi:hypothetical protein
MAIRVCSGCGEAKSDDNFKVVHRRNRTERLTVCKACDKKYHREWYLKNREKVLAQSKVWYEFHSDERKAAAMAWYRANTAKHRKLSRDWHGRSFGFTPETEAALAKIQDGKCAICTREFRSQKETHRDHDHETGKARGLLCSSCNTCLGHYEKRMREAGLVLAPFDAYLANPPTANIKGL